jgi:sRNA-binding carbon storage regulator CsrA
MLVLTRRMTAEIKETDIMITCPNGDVIKVCLKQIRGKQVRLGFVATLGYHIDREEVYQENQAKRDACPNRLITTPAHANLLK